MKIGSVESFTGGLFSSSIVDAPGASKYFVGSIVTYSNELKEKLGIDTSRGVINKKVALAMASKGKEFLGVDVCVSFTGNAGPTAMDGVPVGKVFIAINDKSFELDLLGSRNSIRRQAVAFALEKIKDFYLK